MAPAFPFGFAISWSGHRLFWQVPGGREGGRQACNSPVAGKAIPQAAIRGPRSTPCEMDGWTDTQGRAVVFTGVGGCRGGGSVAESKLLEPLRAQQAG